MASFDVDAHTILSVRHGSRAYGTNLPSSDLDIKGVCIPPKRFLLGFAERFDQHIRQVSEGSDVDSTVYSLAKFCKLASDCNPNIIEVLFVEDDDVLIETSLGRGLRSARHSFLSTKIRHTFSGYAHAQLKRIKSHRAWLLDPPKEPPKREDFGLPTGMKLTKSDLGAFNALSDEAHADLSREALRLYERERAWRNLKTQWDQYQNWKQTRNKSRAGAEAKYGYDTKHGMHLVRLMRMCREILSTGEVLVRRPDAQELLSIRAGAWSYDRLIGHAEELDAECGELYETCTVLPKRPDITAIDDLTVGLTECALFK